MSNEYRILPLLFPPRLIQNILLMGIGNPLRDFTMLVGKNYSLAFDSNERWTPHLDFHSSNFRQYKVTLNQTFVTV